MTVDSSTLNNELATLFLAASKSACARIYQTIGATVIRVPQPTINWTDAGNWSSAERPVTKNILAVNGIAVQKLVPLLTPELISLAKQCAKNLTDSTGTNLPFWTPLQGSWWLLTGETENPTVDYSQSPADWTVRNVILPALQEHLTSLDNVEYPSAEDATRFANEVLSVATASDLSYFTSIPLAGIKLPPSVDSLEAGEGIRVRRLTPDEQGDFLTEWGFATMQLGSPSDLPLIALELISPGPRDGGDQSAASGMIARSQAIIWLTALRLHGYQTAGRVANFRAYPGWAMPTSSAIPLPLPTLSQSWTTLSHEDLLEVEATFKKLAAHNISEPTSKRGSLALHRFSLGASRGSHVDAILDFVIALESLLLPYDEDARRGDLGYRFRIHGAFYIADDKSQRRDIAKRLTDLYDLRSRLVHGGTYPAPDAIENGHRSAELLARRGLLRAVREGFPDAGHFKSMILDA